eukprot:Hpha_TRINITY_DN17093_c0_g1::TRINITY_DN17093_c0_g1_i1::g.166214::m.166214
MAATWLQMVGSWLHLPAARESEKDVRMTTYSILSAMVKVDPEVEDLVRRCEAEMGMVPGRVKVAQLRSENQVPPGRMGESVLVDPEYLRDSPWGAGRVQLLEKLAQIKIGAERREAVTLFFASSMGGACGFGAIALRRRFGATRFLLTVAWPAALLGTAAGAALGCQLPYVTDVNERSLQAALLACNCGTSIRDFSATESLARQKTIEAGEDPSAPRQTDTAKQALRRDAALMVTMYEKRIAVAEAFLSSHPDIASAQCEEQRLLTSAAARGDSKPPQGFSEQQLAHARESLIRDRKALNPSPPACTACSVGASSA